MGACAGIEIELCSSNAVEPDPTSNKTRSVKPQHGQYDSYEGNLRDILYDEFIEAVINETMSTYYPQQSGEGTTKSTKTTKNRYTTRANTVPIVPMAPPIIKKREKPRKPHITPTSTKRRVLHSPSNSFSGSRHKRFGTNSLNNIADDIFNDIQRTVKANSVSLRQPLRGWLSHKQSSSKILSKYVKRWVVVQDGYMLWSDRQMTVRKGVSAQEKKRWNKCIPLRKIKAVSLVFAESDAPWKFKLTLKNREYIWRADSLQMKNRWVDGLKQRMAHAKLASVCSNSDLFSLLE